MQHPLVVTEVTQTVDVEIDRLARPYAGKACQQQGIGEQIVAAAELSFQLVIVLGGEGTGQSVFGSRNVLTPQQAGPRRETVIGHQLEELAQPQ
jgi:hypothetical protein